MFRTNQPVAEDSPLGPTNVYGQTKLMTEQALEWYRQIHGLHFAALRYFNAYGALRGRGEAHQPDRISSRWFSASHSDSANEHPIFGTDYPTPDGTCIHDYIHIADLVSHLLALKRWTKKNN